MSIIDLTYAINDQTPLYPGDPVIEIHVSSNYSEQGFCDQSVTIGTHVGTHIDAPAHMIEGGKMLKEYGPERFFAQATCLDVSSDISLEAIKAADITNCDAVIFFTGASEWSDRDDYYAKYQVLPDGIGDYLAEKGILLIGLDTVSTDNVDGFPLHKAILGKDILILENLTNLHELIGQKFELIALPMKLEQDGAPTRVIARLR